MITQQKIINKPSITVFDVANWFLSKHDNIHHKRLQLLVYLTYGHSLVFFNEPEYLDTHFFNAEFEAWVNFPCCKILYNKYKDYGSQYIEKYTGPLADFSLDELNLLEEVDNLYDNWTTNELSFDYKHQKPYQKTRGYLTCDYAPSNEIMKDEDIFDYFINLYKFYNPDSLKHTNNMNKFKEEYEN